MNNNTGHFAIAALLLALLALAVFLGFSGCSPESAMQSRLAKLLESNGYTLYTPFRAADFPGSMFVLANDSRGRPTEFVVSRFNETFDVPEDELFDQDGDQVQWFDKLGETFNFSSDVGLKLASVLVEPELASKYASTIDISFDDPKRRHVITLAHLGELAPNLATSTKNALREQQRIEQLGNVYLVLETVQVNGLTINVRLKQEFTGKLELEKLRALAKADVEVGAEKEGMISLSSATPLIIGYKAIVVPEAIIGTQVSATDATDLEFVTATALTKLKE
jgi:hypothetical protein